MTKTTKSVPAGFHTLTPALVVSDGKAAVEFYQKAFGAEVSSMLPMPDGRIGHAELKIGDSTLMLADEFPEMEGPGASPKTLGGVTGSLWVYLEDVDAAFERAVGAGATAAEAPNDAFWGDRCCKLIDPFGHEWALATHVEDLTPEELAQRAEAAGFPPPDMAKE